MKLRVFFEELLREEGWENFSVSDGISRWKTLRKGEEHICALVETALGSGVRGRGLGVLRVLQPADSSYANISFRGHFSDHTTKLVDFLHERGRASQGITLKYTTEISERGDRVGKRWATAEQIASKLTRCLSAVGVNGVGGAWAPVSDAPRFWRLPVGAHPQPTYLPHGEAGVVGGSIGEVLDLLYPELSDLQRVELGLRLLGEL